MTVYVSESSPSVLAGISKMKSAMVEDYKSFITPLENSAISTLIADSSPRRAKMNEEYVNSFEVKYGRKYIKILSNHSATAFIVATDEDKKFTKGDILKPAGYAAPARNAARGNVLDGGYSINWTGPLYL